VPPRVLRNSPHGCGAHSCFAAAGTRPWGRWIPPRAGSLTFITSPPPLCDRRCRWPAPATPTPHAPTSQLGRVALEFGGHGHRHKPQDFGALGVQVHSHRGDARIAELANRWIGHPPPPRQPTRRNPILPHLHRNISEPH